MPPHRGGHREKQRPGHPELSELFSGAWDAGGLQGETKQSQTGRHGEMERHKLGSAPMGFSVGIGQGWGDKMKENTLQP